MGQVGIGYLKTQRQRHSPETYKAYLTTGLMTRCLVGIGGAFNVLMEAGVPRLPERGY